MIEASFSQFFALIIICVIGFFVIRIPVYIARSRNMNPKDIRTINLLCWCGLLFGITWLIALIWSIVGNNFLPEIKVKSEAPKEDRYAQLERIARLRDSGALSEEEFQEHKTQILSRTDN